MTIATGIAIERLEGPQDHSMGAKILDGLKQKSRRNLVFISISIAGPFSYCTKREPAEQRSVLQATQHQDPKNSNFGWHN